MKTEPDETMLTLWMDGELEGEELRQMEAWAADHPELLAERDAIRAMNAQISANVPSSIEPPYPDFFNQRILRAIEDEQATREVSTQATAAPKRGFWQWLAAPLAVGAMALCFYLGTQVNQPSPSAPTVAVTSPSVYTPDGEVRANIFDSDDANATVIVLEGLEAIPDNLDMAGSPNPDETGSMAVSTDFSF